MATLVSFLLITDSHYSFFVQLNWLIPIVGSFRYHSVDYYLSIHLLPRCAGCAVFYVTVLHSAVQLLGVVDWLVTCFVVLLQFCYLVPSYSSPRVLYPLFYLFLVINVIFFYFTFCGCFWLWLWTLRYFMVALSFLSILRFFTATTCTRFLRYHVTTQLFFLYLPLLVPSSSVLPYIAISLLLFVAITTMFSCTRCHALYVRFVRSSFICSFTHAHAFCLCFIVFIPGFTVAFYFYILISTIFGRSTAGFTFLLFCIHIPLLRRLLLTLLRYSYNFALYFGSSRWDARGVLPVRLFLPFDTLPSCCTLLPPVTAVFSLPHRLLPCSWCLPSCCALCVYSPWVVAALHYFIYIVYHTFGSLVIFCHVRLRSHTFTRWFSFFFIRFVVVSSFAFTCWTAIPYSVIL